MPSICLVNGRQMAIYRAHWLRLSRKMAKITKSLGMVFVSPPGCDLGTEGWALRPFFFGRSVQHLGATKVRQLKARSAGVRRGAREHLGVFHCATDGNHRNHGLGPGLRTCRYRARGRRVAAYL